VLHRVVETEPLTYQDRVIRNCEATYDQLAADYDRHLQRDCGYRSPQRLARALIADVGPSGSWLDLGAGTGLVGEALFELGAPLSLSMVAVDVSAAMLDHIACPLYVERHQADVLRGLPVERGSFDGAIAVGLMEYILDVPAFVGQVSDALVPGGWFAFTFCPNDLGRVQLFDEETDLHCHDGAMVEASLGEAGFEIRRRKEFPAYVNGEQGWIRHRMLTARRRP
jgi:predicted TPR repeat methyltransferase